MYRVKSRQNVIRRRKVAALCLLASSFEKKEKKCRMKKMPHIYTIYKHVQKLDIIFHLLS
jgi:hypothetical protein